jgi:hypothetical protein
MAAIVVTMAYSFFGTMAIMYLLHFTMGIRCSEEHESMGLDEAMHGERHLVLTIADLTKDGANPIELHIRTGDRDGDTDQSEGNSPQPLEKSSQQMQT